MLQEQLPTPIHSAKAAEPEKPPTNTTTGSSFSSSTSGPTEPAGRAGPPDPDQRRHGLRIVADVVERDLEAEPELVLAGVQQRRAPHAGGGRRRPLVHRVHLLHLVQELVRLGHDVAPRRGDRRAPVPRGHAQRRARLPLELDYHVADVLGPVERQDRPPAHEVQVRVELGRVVVECDAD